MAAEGHYFDLMQRSFADVPVNEAGVATLPFLEASADLVKLFDLFGSKAFAVVQSDLTGNITKIRTRHDSHPTQSGTLEAIVASEKGEKKRDATQGLLWLTRGLHFTAAGLRHSIQHPNDELSTSFTAGYETTLKPHHSFVVRPIFALAMKACPYRKDFYAKLGTPDQVDAQLAKWLSALEKIVARIEAFYASGNYGKGL